MDPGSNNGENFDPASSRIAELAAALTRISACTTPQATLQELLAAFRQLIPRIGYALIHAGRDTDHPQPRVEPGHTLEEDQLQGLLAFLPSLNLSAVLTVRTPWVIDSPQSAETLRACGIGDLLLIPIFTQEDPSNQLLALTRRVGEARFSAEDTQAAVLLITQAVSAIQTAQLLVNLEVRNHELETILQSSLQLTASLDLKQVLDAVLVGVFRLSPPTHDAHIFLYQDGTLEFGASLWQDGRKDVPFSKPRPQGLTATVARTGKMILVDDLQTHPLYLSSGLGWQGSIVSLPLVVQDHVVGVMNLAALQPGQYSAESLRPLRLLADQAAIAIENARLHAIIQQEAFTDALTGLPNRRAMDRELEDEIRRSARYHHHFALLILDLDGFKLINDTYGHPVGDQALIWFSQKLPTLVRDTDFVARYGGDELVVILPETHKQVAESVYQRIFEFFERETFHFQDEICQPITVSIGLSLFPEDGKSADRLLKIADQRLYHHKGRRKALPR